MVKFSPFRVACIGYPLTATTDSLWLWKSYTNPKKKGKKAVSEATPMTATGLPENEQAVLSALLGKVSEYCWFRADKIKSATLLQDGEKIDTWIDILKMRGQPFEPGEKRTFIQFLFEFAYKMGSANNDDVAMAQVAPDQETRQALMHQFDLWMNKEAPYQPGQPEEDWRGGRIAFLLDFFAYKIDPIIAEEEYRR